MSEAITTSIMALISRKLLQVENLVRTVSKQIGPQGPVGEQGLVGPVGPQGKIGNIGPRGHTGQTGPAGANGEQGIQGVSGIRGERGAPGIAGAQGISGATGPQGEKGDTGPAPAHEWQGTKLRFQKPDGKWGKLTDLKGAKGDGGGTVIVRGGGGSSSGGGMGDLLPGNPNVEPTGIAVAQAGQWVNLSWPAFIQTIAGAIDMASEFSRRSDFVGETIIYRGEAAPGAVESAAVWRIKRIEFITGVDGKSDIDEKWAGGTAGFVNVWSDRAILEYA